MSEMHVLLIPGRAGSGPWHWQQWLARELDHHGGVPVVLPGFDGSPRPVLRDRIRVLRECLDAVPEAAQLVVAAQGCGAALWLHHAATVDARSRRADQVLLAAPPEPSWRRPDVQGFVPYPIDAHALRRAGGVTRLVAGTGDPTLPVSSAHSLADALQVELDVIPDGEQLDTSSGYGQWPSMLRWALYGTVPLLDRFDGEAHTAGYLPSRLRPA